MSFYLKKHTLSKEELEEVIEILSSCSDVQETYYDCDDEERALLRRAFKEKFLPEAP